MSSKEQNTNNSQTTASNADNKKAKKKRSLFQKIVNVFLYFFLGLFILLLIIIGVSQTSVFQNFLREQVIEIANGELNGELYIGEIEGTIFTSLILKNTTISMGNDTLLNSNSIVVKTSPLQLLLKKIKVREIEINNTNISLLIDSTGTLNLSKLFPASETVDTTESEFPFTIEVANLELNNVNFSYQQYYNKNSSASYESMNMDDFRADDLNLALSAFANINRNEYEVEIKDFSFKPNIDSFLLKDLTGAFLVHPNELAVKNFNIVTDFSDIELNGNLKNFNLFDTTGNTDINQSPLELQFLASKFNFKDLNAFAPSIDMLKGSIYADLNANGTLSNLNMEHLGIEYLDTHIEAEGTIKNVIDGKSIFINTSFYNTHIVQSDIKQLLPSIDVPLYEEYGKLVFDKLDFVGNPLDFKTNFFLKTDRGNLLADLDLNLKPENIEYNLSFSTQGFDISPIAGVLTNLNLNGKINGKGIDPAEYLSTDIFLNGNGSAVKGIQLDSLIFVAHAENKNIDFDLNVTSDTAKVDLAGLFNFETKGHPKYEIDGSINNFNMATLTDDTSMVTSINLNIDVEGENFDPEKMNLFLVTTLYQTYINDIFIDSTRVIVDLRRGDEGERIINIISDLADITLQGNFSITQTIGLASKEAALISTVIQNKIDEIMPQESEAKEELKNQLSNLSNVTTPEEPIDSVISIDYLIDLKDFNLISLFIQDQRLEVDGDISGIINSDGDSIKFSLNSTMEYLKYWGEKDIFFLSNFNLQTNIAKSLSNNSFEDIYLGLHLKTDRIFAGADIYDIDLDMELENNSAIIHFSSRLENYAAVNLNGEIDLAENEINLLLDTLDIEYNNYKLSNENPIDISYSNERIDINDFVMARNGGNLSISGYLSRDGNQDLKIGLNHINASDLSKNIFDMRPENSVNADINLTTNITGSFNDPNIDINLKVDSIIYRNKNFGVLNGSLNYDNQNLKTNIYFVDSTFTKDKPALSITGNIPINLSLEGSEELFPEGKEMDISLVAEDFNLGAFGDVLPAVNRLRGNLTADLHVAGTPDNLNPNGTLILRNGVFFLEANNLEYNAGLKVNISREELVLDSLLLSNVKGTENGGTMRGSGSASLENFNITSSHFSINGTLKVLGEESKSASPSIYGDLVIGTKGNLTFKLSESRAFLEAPIVIKQADLTFPPSAGGYQAQSENYIYKFASDTVSIDEKEMDFESLIELSQKRDEAKKASNGLFEFFDYRINVTVEDEATINFVLSKEFNQSLTAVISGDVLYEKIGGRPDIQGELKLLDESTLEFIKTLSADGTIRFESEISNPYLNITATYREYYAPKTESGDAREVPVEVRIKIEGPLKQLDQKLIQGEDNVAVYYGEESIQNDNPTPRYNASDAIFFLITSEFRDQASQQQRDFVASQAAAIAGSILGGFLNNQLGSIVKNIEIRQTANQGTRISIAGQAGDFRYTIGGTTKVFNDLSQANVKIEYPVINSLILRLERKETITGTSITNEMINELGLQYRFKF